MKNLKQWRFIDTGYNDGIFNMAVDEALLKKYNPEDSLPVFRLYSWNPPAISLGRFQNPLEVLNLEECIKKNITVVHRITGGGAIFHSEELTYSIVCPGYFGDKLSVKDSYKKLCNFLILAYRELGLDAYFAGNNPDNRHAPPQFCFAGREVYDILIGGKKIGGNAQKRKRNIIFQLGSIPLRINFDDTYRFFKNIPCDIEKNIACLESLKCVASIEELKNIVKRSFQRNLGIELIPDEPTNKEKEAARKLQEHRRYSGLNFYQDYNYETHSALA